MSTPPDDGPNGRVPAVVQQHSGEFFDGARVLTGARHAESRIDPDRGLRVTVIDLDDSDVAAITELARRLGIQEWVRIERADPAALRDWERLRHDLIALREAGPGVLQRLPAPDPGYRRPPVVIHLAAYAERTAADLHERYGDFVSLRVGALPYPSRSDRPRPPRSPVAEWTPADPDELRVQLDGPLSIRSGHSATHHHLLLTNLSDRPLGVRTNGNVTAAIVDTATGATVGGYAGAQAAPLIIFTAAPSETVRIPLLVGTASYHPQLGYAVPPGAWHLIAPMDLDDGRHVVSPPLPLTITD